MINREIQRKKREAHREKLKEKAERIGMLEEILREQEARVSDRQDIDYIRGLRRRIARTANELQNMNQV